VKREAAEVPRDVARAESSAFRRRARQFVEAYDDTRQLADWMETIGVPPAGPLTSEDLAGLPLPERLMT
jgi:hypothetical protein